MLTTTRVFGDNAKVWAITPLNTAKAQASDVTRAADHMRRNNINGGFDMTEGATPVPRMQEGTYYVEACDANAINAIPGILRLYNLKGVPVCACVHS